MYSKMLKSLLIVICLVVFTSCSYFLDDKKKPSEKIYNLSLNEKAGVGCLHEHNEVMQDYFDMKRTDKEIAVAVLEQKKCIRNAVDLFVKYTEGSSGNQYNSEEIHKFLIDVIDEYSFLPVFMEEALRLKSSLIGGNPFVVTKDEINRLLPIVDFVYDKLALHASQRQYLFSNESLELNKANRVAFEKAVKDFEKSIAEFKNLPIKNTGLFDYDSLARLIVMIVGDNSKSEWTDHLALINALQAMITVGQQGEIAASKLPFAVSNLSELWLSYVEFNKFLKNDTFYTDLSAIFTFPGLLTRLVKDHLVFENGKDEILNNVQNRILGALKNSVVAAPEQKMPLGYFDALIDVLANMGSFPEYLSKDTIKGMLPDFVGRWANKKVCIEPVDATIETPEADLCKRKFISPENVDNLIEIVDLWKERQEWVNQVGEHQRQSVSIKNKKTSSINVQSFKSALSSISHVHWEDYVVVGTTEFVYKDLVILNAIYTLGEIFLRPFNRNWEKASTIDYYMSEAQVQTVYYWLRDIGVDLKIVDPRSRLSGQSAFTEANLFTSVGNNPKTFDFLELIEYLEISISTSIRSVYLMENKFEDCRLEGTNDVFNFPKLEPNCFRKELRENFHEYYLESLPKMTRYFETGHGQEVLEGFIRLAEKASRQGFLVNEPIETDTVRTMSSILQYTESLFLRFDENGDDVIRIEEFEKALEHIKPNLKVLIDRTLDESTKTLIYRTFPEFEKLLVTYAIATGELPPLLFAESSLGKGFRFAQLWDFDRSNQLNDKVKEETNSWFQTIIGGIRKWGTQALEPKEGEETKKSGFRSFLLDALKDLKGWEEAVDSWLKKDATVRREDVLTVISGLSDFSRISRIKKIKTLVNEYELEFDAVITDVNHPVFEKLIVEFYCSTELDADTKKWLLDNQKKYWIKDDVDHNMEIRFWDGEKLEIPSLITGWEGSVVKKMIELMRDDKVIGPYCNLPYVAEIHKPIDLDRERRKAEREARFEERRRIREQLKQLPPEYFQ